jgi:hypothetical protein
MQDQKSAALAGVASASVASEPTTTICANRLYHDFALQVVSRITRGDGQSHEIIEQTEQPARTFSGQAGGWHVLKLPAGLTPGTYLLQVEVTLAGGKPHSREASFVVR